MAGASGSGTHEDHHLVHGTNGPALWSDASASPAATADLPPNIAYLPQAAMAAPTAAHVAAAGSHEAAADHPMAAVVAGQDSAADEAAGGTPSSAGDSSDCTTGPAAVESSPPTSPGDSTPSGSRAPPATPSGSLAPPAPPTHAPPNAAGAPPPPRGVIARNVNLIETLSTSSYQSQPLDQPYWPYPRRRTLVRWAVDQAPLPPAGEPPHFFVMACHHPSGRAIACGRAVALGACGGTWGAFGPEPRGFANITHALNAMALDNPDMCEIRVLIR